LSEASRYNDYTIPPLQQTLDEIKKEFATHVFLKAVEESELVGSVRGYQKNDTCHVGRLIVLPEHQGKGIGSALLKEIEKYFDEARRFELFTGTKSRENLHLYDRHGYREFKTERLKNNVTLVYMEKQIK
jgi:ribosomal protein S18 acetylase RimI-like enzyme